MKTIVAQIRLKTADFKFNLENIVKNINSDCDLIVFPQIDIEDLGGKDMVFDDNCMSAQTKLYQEIAAKNYKQNIILGDILIRNGEVVERKFLFLILLLRMLIATCIFLQKTDIMQ